MADELEKYRQILEREDGEFRRAMEAEVSISSCPRFSSNCQMIIHSSMSFANFI